jgi:tetratricopeptide (TPR) repeat protein
MFDKGLAALTDERPLEAVDHFLDAMQLEQRLRVRHADMRYLSYYGLSLARASRATQAALEACGLAVQHDPTNPELWLNLGRVHSLAVRLPEAIRCYERGLRLDPAHRGLRLELSRIDRRSRRVLSALDRSHPLNRWTGKLRVFFRARAGLTACAPGARSP